MTAILKPVPSRSVWNAMRLPSGDHEGVSSRSCLSCRVRAMGWEPSASMTMMVESTVPASVSRKYAMRFQSGDHAGRSCDPVPFVRIVGLDPSACMTQICMLGLKNQGVPVWRSRQPLFSLVSPRLASSCGSLLARRWQSKGSQDS